MPPSYVAEFLRWRNAPVSERDRIVRDQIKTDAVAELLPPLIEGDAERVAKLPAHDGKTFATILPRERGDWVAWMRALLKAAQDWRSQVHLLAAFQSMGGRL